MRVETQRTDAGQAAVESALTLPMLVFLVLGTLQLFMLLQAKVMAQYAAFQANRVGSVMHGRCDAMTHAALLALTPTLRSFMGPTWAGSPGQKLGAAFREVKDNSFAYLGWGAEDILWIIRERPRFPGDDPVQAQREFDRLLNNVGQSPTRLELRVIFWCPLKIPFADWVFSRLALASFGLRDYVAQNPLMVRQTANWGRGPTRRPQAPIAVEYARRIAAKHYVFPIEVTSTMRMMSPVKISEFNNPNCGNTPSSL